MSTKDKKKGKKDSNPAQIVSQERAQALNWALIASRLLEEDFFDDMLNSVNKADQTQFEAICKKAKISPMVTWQLWTMLSAVYKPKPKTGVVEEMVIPPW